MASVITRLLLRTDTNGVNPTGFTSNMDAPEIFRKCSTLLGRAAQGACSSNLELAHAPVAALATVTATGTGTNADTLTIAGITIRMETSGAVGNQINIGGSVTALMNQVTALINAPGSSWQGICYASNLAGVLTLTASIPGTIGNGLALAISSTALTITHAWGAATAGTEGTFQEYSLGIAASSAQI
jgi:hypothetical protein